MVVKPFDVNGIVEHISANLGRIREKRRNLHVLELLALAKPDAFLVNAMRISSPVPEAEG
jgi:hypothetical protein